VRVSGHFVVGTDDKKALPGGRGPANRLLVQWRLGGPERVHRGLVEAAGDGTWGKKRSLVKAGKFPWGAFFYLWKGENVNTGGPEQRPFPIRGGKEEWPFTSRHSLKADEEKKNGLCGQQSGAKSDSTKSPAGLEKGKRKQARRREEKENPPAVGKKTCFRGRGNPVNTFRRRAPRGAVTKTKGGMPLPAIVESPVFLLWEGVNYDVLGKKKGLAG